MGTEEEVLAVDGTEEEEEEEVREEGGAEVVDEEGREEEEVGAAGTTVVRRFLALGETMPGDVYEKGRRGSALVVHCTRGFRRLDMM
jgi:hypothetical protein